MADLLEFMPLFPDQDEATIRVRWDGWANEGLTVDDVDTWTDVRPGTFFNVSTTPGVREAARQYDAMSEVAAAAFPVWAWGDYLDDHAAFQSIERLASTAAEGEVTFTGPPGTTIPAGTTVSVEPPSEDAQVPDFQTTIGGDLPGGGALTLPVRALEPGSLGDVGAHAVTVLLTPLIDVTVDNAEAIVGGTDPQGDEALRDRILEPFRGTGGANINYLKRVSLAFPGVGRVTVVPLWAGAGTAKIIALTEDGGPVAPSVVTGLQQLLDPIAGRGAGEGAVGQTITVETATALDVAVVATVEPETGYTLDGAAGTIALRAAIEARIRLYVERVEPGGEVVLKAVERQIMEVAGVHDVGDVTLNTVAGNLAVGADEAPVVSPAPVLTEGVLP